VIEVANRFNQLLEAELNFETTNDDTELINQALIWMPDIITEHLHFDTTWNHLAITAKAVRTHPELYEKIFTYLTQVHGNLTLVEQTITSANKKDYRPLLQWLGGYLVAKLSPVIWYDELFRRIDLRDARSDLVVIVGLRYPSDAVAIQTRGGRVLTMSRTGLSADETDITEVQRSSIVPDITIINNGTLEALRITAQALWNDIAAGAAKKQYHTA
ncbi:MAG TPA: hypothetical protein VM581_02180, partial [Magnetospirillaceae bacterium]|nr:hypothetical protein [Magnetospirillaceae bacterium]